MAAQEEIQSYIKSVWELIKPSTRRSGSFQEYKIHEKVEEAKKKVVEIIKEMEIPQHEEVRIVGIAAPDGTPFPFQSTFTVTVKDQGESTEKPKLSKLTESLKDNDDEKDSDDTENQYEPPVVRVVGILAPDGTSLPLPSTSRSETAGLQGSIEKKKQAEGEKDKFYWDEDHAGDFFDDYAEYRKAQEKGTKENVRHLYRLLFWLDFLSSGYNRNKQNYRHF